jgi:hypothetical protein
MLSKAIGQLLDCWTAGLLDCFRVLGQPLSNSEKALEAAEKCLKKTDTRRANVPIAG